MLSTFQPMYAIDSVQITGQCRRLPAKQTGSSSLHRPQWRQGRSVFTVRPRPELACHFERLELILAFSPESSTRLQVFYSAAQQPFGIRSGRVSSKLLEAPAFKSPRGGAELHGYLHLYEYELQQGMIDSHNVDPLQYRNTLSGIYSLIPKSFFLMPWYAITASVIFQTTSPSSQT